MGKYALALDFGNGGGRTFFLDLESGHSFSAYQSWSYYSPNGDGFITEFNASEFFNVFCNLVNGIIYQHKISPDDVVGISVTSMRHTCVFLDKDGKEITDEKKRKGVAPTSRVKQENIEKFTAEANELLDKDIDFEITKIKAESMGEPVCEVSDPKDPKKTKTIELTPALLSSVAWLIE